MIVNHDREKLINVIVFFALNTQYCGKIKLLKLLYLFDFEHFRQTGRSSTGLEYRAWKLGPVPVAFYQEWDVLEPDLAAAIEIVPERVIDFTRETVRARQEFDDRHFTPRELRLMTELAERFRDEYSRPLVNFTHRERGPWARIWDEGRGDDARIPYSLAVADDAPDRDAILASAHERASMLAADRQH